MAKYVINSPLQLLDSNGNTVSGGTFKFFEPGASATAKAVFKYVAGSYVSAGTEISTNARGMPEVGGTQILLYGDGDYYVRVFDASAVELEPYEQIEGAGSSGAAATEWTLSELTPTFISATSFSVDGDHRSKFQVKMRVKSSNTGGDMYGKITTSVFTSVTTVTLVNAGSDVLDAGLSSVSTGLLTADNPSYPASLQADLIDGNDNEVLIRGSVASAVNEVTITNAATGNQAKIEGSGEAAGAGLIIQGTGTDSSVDLNSTGTGEINVNGTAVRPIFLVDPPEVLATNLTLDAWTTINSTTLGTATAKAAILRGYITGTRSATLAKMRLFARKTGSALGLVDTTFVSEARSYTASVVAQVAVDVAEFTVNLDSSYDFDYYVESNLCTNTSTTFITLVGYYV